MMSKRKKNVKIANLQFLLSILIVVIHANCLFINLPGTELQYIYGKNYASFVELLFSEGIARIAVPLFFIISGYLFFNNFSGSVKEYGKKLKRRFFSLVIPYLFWSSVTFFAFYLAQKIPALSAYFTTRDNSQISLRVIFDNVIVSSYNSPLWFVQYLIVFAVLSIAIFWCVKKVPFLFSAIALLGWVFDFFGVPINWGIRLDAIFFYLLGVEIALKKDVFVRLKEKINKTWILLIVLLFYGTIQIIRTGLLCGKSPSLLLNGEYNAVLHYLGSVGILLGVFLAWFGFDYIFKSEKEWSVAGFSFLLFVAHHPIVNIVKKLLFKLVGVSVHTSLWVYIGSIILTIGFIIALGYVLKRYFTWLFSFICGGR